MVGASGFEPPTSWSRTRRSSQAEPRPELFYCSKTRSLQSTFSATPRSAAPADKSCVKCAILLVVLAFFPLPAEQAADALSSLSLEQLLALDVTSVGKKRERLDRAAAAVFVITQEDIRRMGATSIPEALRLAPGLHVVRVNSRTWAITARGFNSIFSNKLLVLIDGRSIYSPLFAGVWWDQDVMLDDVERIEVIRGPAAAIWGVNAVNGVINIITRPASQTTGNLLSVTTGTEERSITRFRHGEAFGKTGAYRVYGQYSHRFLFSPSPSFGDSYWLEFAPKEGQTLMFQGDIAQGTGFEFEHSSYPVFLPNSVTRYDNHRNAGSFLGRWSVTHRSGAETTIQGYYDEVNRFSNDIDVDVDVMDAEMQHRRTRGRHELSFSTGFRGIADRTSGTEFARFVPSERSYGIGHVSMVDGISLWGGRVQLTTGARLERTPFSGWSLQPTVRGQWSISRLQSVWAAVSRAIRASSRLEAGFERVYPGSGFAYRGGTTQPETLFAVEAGYRASIRNKLTFDLAGFRNRYNHLRSFEFRRFEMRNELPIAWYEMDFLAGAYIWGGEGVVSWDPSTRLRVCGSYTGLWVKNVLTSGSSDVFWPASSRSSPVHQWQTQSSLQLRRSLNWNTNLYYYGKAMMGERGRIPATILPQHLHIDTRLAFRRESTEWSIGVRNITANKTGWFVEPGPAPERNRRAFYARLTWWF
jgi:iron complex outermembrane recepter protein